MFWKFFASFNTLRTLTFLIQLMQWCCVQNRSSLLSQAYLRSVKRKRCSGYDSSCENRISTVKCEIGTLSASRRVHNFNDFRAGYFRRFAWRSTRARLPPASKWSATLEWNRWRGVLLLSEAMMSYQMIAEWFAPSTSAVLFMLKGISSLTNTSPLFESWS